MTFVEGINLPDLKAVVRFTTAEQALDLIV